MSLTHYPLLILWYTKHFTFEESYFTFWRPYQFYGNSHNTVQVRCFTINARHTACLDCILDLIKQVLPLIMLGGKKLRSWEAVSKKILAIGGKSGLCAKIYLKICGKFYFLPTKFYIFPALLYLTQTFSCSVLLFHKQTGIRVI